MSEVSNRISSFVGRIGLCLNLIQRDGWMYGKKGLYIRFIIN